jgi:DDE family transposase
VITILGDMIDERAIRERYEAIRDQLDERGRRLFAAAEARSAGRGGVVAVSRATGLARGTIERGLKDLDQPAPPGGRVRRAGSGRRRLTAKDPTLLEDLRRLVEPVTLGDPMRPLLWVSKSHVKLAKALQKMGHAVSPNTVRQLLHQLGYGRRANRKANDGRQHADRDAQFEHINARVLTFQAENQPVISVDTKKKELVGNYTNKGSEYRPEGQPRRTEVHDFENKELGKVVPYGVYDLADNSGWVSLGVTSDTAEFAVNAIRSWFDKKGRTLYPAASRLMITADCGGSNGARVRLRRLQWSPRATVETRASGLGRPDRADDLGVPLPARNFQVEQDRAPPFLPYFAKLAWPSLDQPPRRDRTDCRYHHDDRPDGRVRTGHQHLPEGDQGHRH